jgi:hypothetical protein
MRRLVCLACGDRVELLGSDAKCGCERSTARLEGGAWVYTGPAMVAIPMPVHEPEHRCMSERLIEVPDDELSYRARVEPLL